MEEISYPISVQLRVVHHLVYVAESTSVDAYILRLEAGSSWLPCSDLVRGVSLGQN